VVYDLTAVDYEKLHRQWGASEADWNKFRAMISSFLSTFLGHVHHPFRLEVMGRIRRGKEPRGRLPDTTPAQFWKVVAAAVDHAKASYVAMAVLGVGPKEYLGIRREDLSPAQRTVTINGTYTAHRQRVVAVDDRLWDWIERAVPSQLQYRWLNTYWKRACQDAEVQDLRMYDLRQLIVTNREKTRHYLAILPYRFPTESH
jgi:integrase